MLVVPSILAVLILPACSGSVSVGGFTVDKAELEEQVATELAEQQKQDPPNITCPEDLDAKVGATTTCVLDVTGDPKEYDVAVKVTSVDEGAKTVKFDVEVASTPNS
jgi:hypothetical protein